MTWKLREAELQHERDRVEMGQSMDIERLAEIMPHVFPAGSLPDETDPITFTRRELEIFRHIYFPTKTTVLRIVRGLTEKSFAAMTGSS